MTITMMDRPARPAPLHEDYFVRAAQTLREHHEAAGRACPACGSVWPCTRALAAAFVLDMHDDMHDDMYGAASTAGC